MNDGAGLSLDADPSGGRDGLYGEGKTSWEGMLCVIFPDGTRQYVKSDRSPLEHEIASAITRLGDEQYEASKIALPRET
jgi:hypothetical protein